MTNYNGGYTNYADRTGSNVFFRACDRSTKTGTIKSGQVLKANTFLQSDANGKLIAHQGMAEQALVTFADITNGQTLILGGLTFTASAAGTVKANLVTAFKGITAGMTAAQANAANPVTDGSFTSGTFGSWNTYKSSTADSVLFVSTAPNTNPTDIADSGTATDPTIVVISGANAALGLYPKIAGVTVYDVDASGGDVDAAIYLEASFWADALVWANNPLTDTITLYDGSTKAVTDYYTGATTDNLKKKFVEGSEFSELGFHLAGELLQV